jgi:RNA recognition motif-containing protein
MIMKLLVRNLAVATTEEKLVSLFSEHGKVQSCSLVLDSKTGKSKGFGFIEMPKPGEAKAAMKSLNGFKLAGNIIRVKKAESKASESEVAEQPATPVQFKQSAKKAPATKKAILEGPIVKDNLDGEKIDNSDNVANIYGKVKKSDDF